MSNFSNVIQQKLVPFMGKVSSNKVIMSLTAGMMAIMPLTLGTFLIAIASNFPIAAWTNWLAATGLSTHMSAVIGATTELTGLYIVFSVAYNYAKLKESDGMTAGILSLASFIILMPQKVKFPDGTAVDALAKTYLGSGGIFVSMIVAILVTSLYCYLDKKGLVLKLPDSVPEMVSKSLGPTFIAMIIFVVVFLVRVGLDYTSYKTIFDFISTLIGKPIMSFGTSPWSLIGVFTLTSIFWCFGIHPASIMSVYVPVVTAAAIGNITAYQSGAELPYLAFGAMFLFLAIGGTGSTLGLAIDMVLFSKSERFKALGKLAIVPGLFNISEPLVFGTPIIFNPIFFIPMALSNIVTGSICLLFVKLGAFKSFNPAVGLPWTMPAPIQALLQTGIMAALGVCCAILAVTVLYFPFFKLADKQALKEEQQV